MAHNALKVNNKTSAALSDAIGSAAQGNILTYTAGAWKGAAPAPVNLAETPAMYAGPKAPLTYVTTSNSYFSSFGASARVDVTTALATHSLLTYNSTIAAAPAYGGVFYFRLRLFGYYFIHATINPRQINTIGYYVIRQGNTIQSHAVKIDNQTGEKNSATIQAIVYTPGDRFYTIEWLSGTGQRPHGVHASFISFSAVKIG